MPTESIPTPSDSELAEKLLREAAALALAIRAKGLESLRAGRQIKANAADFATAADHAAEEFIYKQLRLARPEDSILGEVFCRSPCDGDFGHGPEVNGREFRHC